jgi:hypothetical protein
MRQDVLGRVRMYQDTLGIGIIYIKVYALVYVLNGLWSTTLYILHSPMARPMEEPRRGYSLEARLLVLMLIYLGYFVALIYSEVRQLTLSMVQLVPLFEKTNTSDKKSTMEPFNNWSNDAGVRTSPKLIHDLLRILINL